MTKEKIVKELQEFLDDYRNNKLTYFNIDSLTMDEFYLVHRMFTPQEVKILLTAIYVVNCTPTSFKKDVDTLFNYIYDTTEENEDEDIEVELKMYEDMRDYIKNGTSPINKVEDTYKKFNLDKYFDMLYN